MATPKIVADFETQLSTAIAIGGTSFTLASATDDDGVALPTGLYYFTVDNGSSAKEYLAGTLTGTTVTAVVSVSRQGVETSGAVRAHRVGASVILTDFATYMVYMNAIALVGAPDASTAAKGVVEIATQAEVDAGTGTGGTLAKLAVSPDTVRAGNFNDYVADTGSANVCAIAPSPAIIAYAMGQVFVFKAVAANTTATTLNVNALGAKTIKKNLNVDLASGDIQIGQMVAVIYDGTNFQLLSHPSPTKTVLTGFVGKTGSASKTLDDASTTQVIAHGLGVAPSKIRIKTNNASAAGQSAIADGTWYAGGTYSSVAADLEEGGGSSVIDVFEQSTSYIIKLFNSAGGITGGFQTATVTVDATNITLSWTKNASPSGSVSFLWEAEGYTTSSAAA